ncbi:glycosyltransferase family 2 protein [Dongia sp.]|uniref:glycosyltransferase family 2 protein n=1 Tax=Dongia sp. TaxID=1977262 RepID=UPI003752FBA4
MPRFSIIILCKDRLEHLRQSLPRALAQPDAETIVVDYDCPAGTAAAVARDFPAARVVKIDDAPILNIAIGRNRGAAAARGEWLMFIDADILPAPDFLASIAPQLRNGRFFRFGPAKVGIIGTNGSCILHRDDFKLADGYDEAFEGYGCEDTDFYIRLDMLGIRSERLSLDLIDIIAHDDATRVRYTRYPSKLRNQRVNGAYLMVKTSLLRSLGSKSMAPEQCKQLYGLIRDVVEQADETSDKPIHFTLDLPPDQTFMPVPGWDCARRLTFDLRPQAVTRGVVNSV